MMKKQQHNACHLDPYAADESIVAIKAQMNIIFGIFVHAINWMVCAGLRFPLKYSAHVTLCMTIKKPKVFLRPNGIAVQLCGFICAAA